MLNLYRDTYPFSPPIQLFTTTNQTLVFWNTTKRVRIFSFSIPPELHSAEVLHDCRGVLHISEPESHAGTILGEVHHREA